MDKKNLNQHLDIGFSTGEKVAFKVEGPGTIHLTGNIIDDDYDPDMASMMEDDSSEEEDEDVTLNGKRKKGESNGASKKMKMDQMAIINGQEDSDDSDDDSDDDDECETTLGDLDSTTNFAEEE